MVEELSDAGAQAKRCSMVPVYVLGTIWIFLLIASISDLTGEVEELIRVTGGQLCWAYSSMEAHNAKNFAYDTSLAIVIMILWVLIQSGHCRLSLLLFSVVPASWVVMFFVSESCAP